MHSIIKIIDLGLILTFIILMFLWDSSVAAANLAYYLLYGSAIWMGICVSYSILSMVYWEIKGIGVYAYFSHKIVPITSNVDLQSISGVPKKT
jgi:flagellar biosynthesis protein FliR